MEGCPGWLVVHDDGDLAGCTEEGNGRRCPGHDVHHAGGALSCRMVVGGPCDRCADPELVRRAS